MRENAPQECHMSSSQISCPAIAEQHLVYDGWYKLHRVVLQWPDGVQFERHILDNGSAVAVLPYDAERRMCLLVSQPRAPVIAAGHKPILEAIAGNLDGALPADKIMDEAFEEAGVVLSELEEISTIWSLCPVSTERIALYLAPYRASSRRGPGGGACDEDRRN